MNTKRFSLLIMIFNKFKFSKEVDTSMKNEVMKKDAKLAETGFEKYE